MSAQRRYRRFKFEGQFSKGNDAFNHTATFGLNLWWRRATALIIRRNLADGGAPTVLYLACGG
jgi:hypothetical protein